MPRPAADLLRARASRCNRPAVPPGRTISTAARSRFSCTTARRATSSGCFRWGRSGWRRMAPVAVHGASSSTASTGRSGRQVSASAAIAETGRSSRRRLATSRSSRRADRSIAVTRAPALAELRGLAARRGAQIDDFAAGDPVKQPHGQGSRRILDPPGTLGVTGQGRHRTAARPPQRPGRQLGRLQFLAPRLVILAQRQVERRLLQMRAGDGAGALFAIGAAPRLPQPIGSVEARGIVTCDAAGAFEAETAQHRIDQALVRQEPHDVSEVDAGGDRGMRRRPQEQELGDAEPQDVVNGCGARRQRGVEAIGDQRIDLAEPAQHRRHQQPGEGTVARRQLRHHRVVLDRVVERPLAAQHRPDQLEGDVACGWRGRHRGSVVRCCCRHGPKGSRKEVARANTARQASFRKKRVAPRGARRLRRRGAIAILAR